MWTPASEEEIQTAIDNGTLRETSSLDAKVALPQSGRNKDLAKDICAMTVAGGLLLYGVGGDDPTRPDTRAPFDLAGAAERIDQVAQTGIAEPPTIEIRDIPSAEQDGLGYLAVVVPASPRAPHMLTIDGDNRYWGRGETGNRILPEGEVARLYAHREQWEIDRRALLDEVVANFPFDFEAGGDQIGPMVVVARPVVTQADLLRRAAAGAEMDDFLRRQIAQHGLNADPYPNQGSPGVGQTSAIERRGADVWVLSNDRDLSFQYQARLEIHSDGMFIYWHAPTISSGARHRSTVMYLMEQSVTRAVHQALATASWIYQRAGYVGMVDVALAVLDIEHATAASLSGPGFIGQTPSYGAPDYRRNARVTMAELTDDVQSVVRQVLMPLYEVISVRDYDPYNPPSPS